MPCAPDLKNKKGVGLDPCALMSRLLVRHGQDARATDLGHRQTPKASNAWKFHPNPGTTSSNHSHLQRSQFNFANRPVLKARPAAVPCLLNPRHCDKCEFLCLARNCENFSAHLHKNSGADWILLLVRQGWSISFRLNFFRSGVAGMRGAPEPMASGISRDQIGNRDDKSSIVAEFDRKIIVLDYRRV